MDILVKKVENIKGEIEISGSKNAAIPILIGSLLIDGQVVLKQIPDIVDINNIIRIFKKLKIDLIFKNNTVIINNRRRYKNLTFNEIKELRGTSYFWGVFLVKQRKLKTFYPGGCKIGNRPFDLHFKAFKQLGITTIVKNDLIIFKKYKNKMKEITIDLPIKSVGATINVILNSVIGKKKVIINNASVEPEVLDTINFLNKAGSKIIIEKNKIFINGVKKLHSLDYSVMFDRIEAGSYMLLASAFTNSELVLKNIEERYLKNIIDVLNKLGVIINIKNNSLKIISKKELNDINIVIDAYPSFPTDLQQILTAVLLKTNSKIKDLVFPNRIAHVEELKKLSANIEVINEEIIINKSFLYNNVLEGIDLRGTFGLIVAAGMVEGDTIIKNVDNIFRGYENLINKLKDINFIVKIIK